MFIMSNNNIFVRAFSVAWYAVMLWSLRASASTTVLILHQTLRKHNTTTRNQFPVVFQMSDYIPPITAILLPHLGAVAGGIFARRHLDTWYETLKYPSWRPSNKIQPAVWTTLYTSMGYSSYLVWRDGGGFSGDAALPLAWYGAQLALSWAWTPIFFGLRSPKWSFVDGVCLWGGILGTIYTFHGVNAKASYMLLPYFGWVTFSCVLNFRIWRDNPDVKKE